MTGARAAREAAGPSGPGAVRARRGVPQRPAAAAACATSAAKSVCFFSMPSPTTYSVKAWTFAPRALRSCSTVCLSSLTKGWPSSVTSLRYFCTVPSTILATISAGLPDSAAFRDAMERSFSTSESGTPLRSRATGLDAAICIARSLASCSSPPATSTSTPILEPPCT